MKENYEICNIINLSADISRPLNKTQRIKYTCYDASKNYIVCGASSGSIYLFQRIPCKFLQLIPNIFGTISHVTISSQEHYIAYASQKGTILVYVIDLTSMQPTVLTAFYREMTITELKWRQNECQIFFGDVKGNVFLVNLNNFLGRNITNISIHPILFLESPVVQIGVFDQFLLVSNYTKCILCNIETEEFKQIGNQPRDGRFGACFINNVQAEKNESTRIFCARPGVRMWECALDGSVLQTHKFKPALKSCQFVSLLNQKNVDKQPNIQLMDQLYHLQSIHNRFVIAQTENCFFIFDMIQSTASIWNDEFDSIQHIKIIDDDTIVIFSKDGQIFNFQFMKLETFFIDLIETKDEFTNAAQYLLEHMDYFKENIANTKLNAHYKTMIEQLENNDDAKTLIAKVRKEFDELIKNCGQLNVERNFRLKNGMYVIDNQNARITYANVLMHNNYECADDHMSDDELIVDSNCAKEKPTQKISLSLIDTNPFTENDRILQNLFFVYKSLKMSNLSLVDRYADIFDSYDVDGISMLLQQLEHLIIENERDIDLIEAKQYCSRMFLNYFKVELLPELNAKSVDFVVNCFTVSNKNERNEKSTERCNNCKYPLIVDVTTLRYKTIGESIIKYLWLHGKKERCMDIIIEVPAALVIMLKILLNNAFGMNAQTDDINKNTILQTLFACGDKNELKQAIDTYIWFQTNDFWNAFFEKLFILRVNHQIECIKCNEKNELKLKFNLSKTFYTYDFLFNLCAESLNGLSALQLCRQYSQYIPCDALSKNFYLKCLLNS